MNRSYIYQDVIDNIAFEKIQNLDIRKYYLSTLKLNDKIIEKNYNLDIIDLAYYSSEEYLAKEIREKITDNYKVIISLNTQKQKDYVEKVLFDNYFYDDIYYGIKEGKIFIDIYKKEIDILFNDYFYLTKNILESKIIQNFLNLYPPLKSYCVLKSAPVLEFKGPELAWNSLLFIYDSKQASIRLNISF